MKIFSIFNNFKKDKRPTNETEIFEPLPNISSNSSTNTHKYLSLSEPNPSELDPDNYEICKESGWYKKIYLSSLNRLKYSNHGVHINSIETSVKILNEDYETIKPKIYIEIESMGMHGLIVLIKTYEKKRKFHNGLIQPSIVFYEPSNDDYLEDNELKQKNRELYKLKKGGFLRKNSIPFKLYENDPLMYTFTVPSLWMRMDLPEEEFQKIYDLLCQTEDRISELEIDYIIKAPLKDSDNLDEMWEERDKKESLIYFEIEEVNIKRKFDRLI